MQSKHIRALVDGLAENHVSLPLYQKRLRVQLLTKHRHAVPRPLPRRTSKMSHRALAARRVLGLGLFIMLFGALLLSLFLPRPNATQNPALQLAMAAVGKVKGMSPDQVAAISRGYEQIDTCLSEALQSASLHIAAPQEINELLSPKRRPSGWTYLIYTNERQRQVIIALDMHKKPLFVTEKVGTVRAWGPKSD